MEILLGAREFARRLERDIADACASVDVQTVALESDRAGWALARALIAAPHLRRRLSVGRACSAASATPLLAQLCGAGVEVRSSARNHKNTAVIDRRVSYFGGFDFTERSLAGHDMSVRCDDACVAAALASDFEAGWRGRARAVAASAAGIEIMTTDARLNDVAFERVFARVALARRSLIVHSAFLSFPFFGHLRRAAARGVRVAVITSSEQTIASVVRYLGSDPLRSCFALHLTPGACRVRALLIDDACLITGSSGFDYLSYRLRREVMALVTDATAIAQFKALVLVPDLCACTVARHAASTFAAPLIGTRTEIAHDRAGSSVRAQPVALRQQFGAR